MTNYEDDQLNFGLNNEWNYFIFKNNSEPIIDEDYNYSVEEDNNKNHTNSIQIDQTNRDDIIINHQLSVLPDQLEYKMPNPNDYIFPTEQAKALYFKKDPQKKKITARIKKKTTKKPKFSSNIAKKKTAPKQQSSSGKTFTLNAISNPKGLFDPYMKVHELDIPNRTQKQRIDRLEKIKNYEVSFGRKIKKLDIYTNNFDAYEDFENRKNEIEFKRHMYSKDRLYHRDDIRRIIESIPKEKLLYHNTNLEFNFSKYENKIEMLENQIENERRFRYQTNLKYHKMLKEDEEIESSQKKMKSNKNNQLKTTSLNRKSRTPMKTFHRRQNNVMEKIKSKMRLNKSFSNLNPKRNKESIKHQTEKRIKTQAKIIASSVDQMIDRDIDALSKELLQKQKEILQLNTNNHQTQAVNKQKLSLNDNNSKSNPISKSKKNKSSKQNEHLNQQIIPQVPYSNNINNSTIMMPNSGGCISFPNNSLIESSMANEIFLKNNIDSISRINPKDKFTLLAKVNNTIDNYSKGLPQLLDKVNKTISQLNEGNTSIFNNKTSSVIKSAYKSSGQTIQLHINELIEGLIDDLALEIVNDLQLIEDKKNQMNHRENFALSVSTYFFHFKQLCSIEDDVLHQLSSKKHPLTPYIPIEKVRKEHNANIIISSPIEKGDDLFIRYSQIEQFSHDALLIKNKNEKRTYLALVHYNIINDCERYVKEYSNYQKSNRNFAIPNEYGLYDEIVNEEIKTILDQELDNCINQLDNCVNDLFHKELLK